MGISRHVAVSRWCRGAALVVACLASACAPGTDEGAAERATAGSPAVPEALADYVAFLEENAQDPVEYVLGLFSEHDVVILCERWHPEVTQYELFGRIVADPRFAALGGTVFTELGARNLQPALDEVMATPGLGRDEVGRRLTPLFRDLGLHPFWDSTNFFDFLRGIYAVNQGREPAGRIRVRFTDLPIDWRGMTAEGYRRYMETEVPRRDRRMADAVLDGLRRMEADGGPAKALVIMNYRHAFNDFEFADGSRGENTGRYLFEELPGRVANVMLNALALLPGTTDREAVAEPIQKGRWDAAFRAAGIESAGFDFAGSPFGADDFDYFTFRPHDVTYAEVFDGFVFYRPLSEHRLVSGIPGLFDDGFAQEARRRLAVSGHELDPAEVEALFAPAEEPEIETYGDDERLEAMIAGWLDPAG